MATLRIIMAKLKHEYTLVVSRDDLLRWTSEQIERLNLNRSEFDPTIDGAIAALELLRDLLSNIEEARSRGETQVDPSYNILRPPSEITDDDLFGPSKFNQPYDETPPGIEQPPKELNEDNWWHAGDDASDEELPP